MEFVIIFEDKLINNIITLFSYKKMQTKDILKVIKIQRYYIKELMLKVAN